MTTDCALVTALPSELDKLLFHFRHAKQVCKGSQVFFETMSPSGLSLVGATTNGMGQLNAAALAHSIIEYYSPKSIILVGICGGMDRKISLGDVAISNQIVDYELAKIMPKGPETRWSIYQPDPALINKIQAFRNDSWTQYIRTPRPDADGSILPKKHVGLYLSGNKVIADEATAGNLRSFWSRAAAVEMEAAGFAAMLRQIDSAPGFIAIKGICDYADSMKDDRWQAYAADAAASLAYTFVTEQLIPEDLSWPHHQQPVNGAVRDKPSQNEILRVTLQEAYNLSELQTLCFDLNIDWEEIAGQRKSEKIIDLLKYFQRRDRIQDLIDKVNRDNNNILRSFRYN